MRILDDKIEKNRELAFEIFDKVYEVVTANTHLRTQIDRDIILNLIKNLAARINQVPYPEQSEHLRLQVVENLRKLLALYPDEFLPLLQEVALSTSKALQD